MSDAYIDVTFPGGQTSRAFLVTGGLRIQDFGDPSNAFVTLDNNERALLVVLFGGGGGGVAITQDHIFETVSARDAYFDSPDPHLDELLIGTPIVVNVGAPGSPDVRFQVWSGDNQPTSYPSPITTEWADAGNTGLTVAQIQLISGLTAVSINRLPIKNANAYEDSSLSETPDRVVSEKPIRAEFFEANTEGVRFGTSQTSFAGAGLELFDSVNNRQCGIIAKLIGSGRPEEYVDQDEKTEDIQLLSSENSGLFTFTYTIPDRPNRDGVRVSAFTIIPHEEGSGTFSIFKNNSSGSPLVSQTVMDISAGQVGTEVRINLDNAFRLNDGDVAFVSYTGNAVRGETVSTQFFPFLRVHDRDFLVEDLARVTDVDAKEDSLGSPPADGQILSSTASGVRSWIAAPVPSTPRTDEEIRDIVAAALVAGSNITIDVDDPNNTITISGTGGGPVPQPGPNDFRYGLSQQSDPSLVDFLSLTDVASPTDPITISTGVPTEGDYFHIFSANTHDITRINETALGNIVYADPPIAGQSNIFIKETDARIEDGVTYDAYRLGPLRVVPSEDYIVRFS